MQVVWKDVLHQIAVTQGLTVIPRQLKVKKDGVCGTTSSLSSESIRLPRCRESTGCEIDPIHTTLPARICRYLHIASNCPDEPVSLKLSWIISAESGRENII